MIFMCNNQTDVNNHKLSDREIDEKWMREALRQAAEAEHLGEVPVGAVVVRGDTIVGAGFTRNLTDDDCSAHAEIVALRAAGRALGNHRLRDCEIYATIEPCAMCAGAIIHARIKRLIYGAADPKAGAAGSALAVVNHPMLNHMLEVTPGVLEAECAGAVQRFFQNKRVAAQTTAGRETGGEGGI